ncbi:MAG: hypothetical protein OXC41_04780 [Gammaproteobacteria bacterium]|nr:hypothetical protein [Gammaproteobacteria bacterium]
MNPSWQVCTRGHHEQAVRESENISLLRVAEVKLSGGMGVVWTWRSFVLWPGYSMDYAVSSPVIPFRLIDQERV